MARSKPFIFSVCLLIWVLAQSPGASCQIVINEGSNRNYSTVSDEDNEFPDWIEIYNAGDQEINLNNWALTDNPANPQKWLFPNITLEPGAFKLVFCSSKNRRPVTAFVNVAYVQNFTATASQWNTHQLTEPFYWDGISNLLINICSYRSAGYTTNSVFNQTSTDYYATLFNYQDDSDEICHTKYGTRVKQRPNLQLNGVTIGHGTINNSPYDYPAPYGNWYWSARHQILITADDLAAAGLTEGVITSIAFDVVSTDPNTQYDYLDFSFKLVTETELTSEFTPLDQHLTLHTNFSVAGEGEIVSLYNPEQTEVSSLNIQCTGIDHSTGSVPDASENIHTFATPTPGESNNASQYFDSYLLPPQFSLASGLFDAQVAVYMSNPNPQQSVIRYTTNGDNPGPESPVYDGTPVIFYFSGVLKACAFSDDMLPSTTTTASYLIGINHTTPIISVVTQNTNLYGDNGIFDNWWAEWEKSAYAEYFDTANNLIFSQPVGMQIDGGWGGSRSHPQHSFRLELDHSVLGQAPVDYQLIPDRPQRTKYSKFYLRNGSNQFLNLPYKDAFQVTSLGEGTLNHYSAMEPVSVYINGQYFGLYELREKIDEEYFEVYEDADEDSLDILTVSAWYSSVLRATAGSVENFWNSYEAFLSLDPAQEDYVASADHYFDMNSYADYIIAEAYTHNTDWPQNNIKMYRSEKTGYRFRFCIIDLELSLQPGGWSSAGDNPIDYLFSRDSNNPYINIWLRSIENEQFKNYFINRFADMMNTTYLSEKLLEKEQEMFSKMAAEMPKEFARWGDPGNVAGQMAAFVEKHNILRSEYQSRTMFVRDYITSGFDLVKQVDVGLDVFPENAGRIKISTIIPDSLPWTGVYFDGNPVSLIAIPENGYEFLYWQTNDVLTEQNPEDTITLNISQSTEFIAVFAQTETQGKITISEINYHSDSTRDAGDWVELLNFGDGQIDISHWKFTDSTLFNEFVFPDGTLLQPGERLVLSSDPGLFIQQHGSIDNFYEIEFGFSNSGEPLTLIDENGFAYLSMHYTDSLPWQEAADGHGRTLELRNDTLNPAIALNWFAGCMGGSPGQAYMACTEDIIFNEINYNSDADADAGDWVELHNTGDADIDISGWTFRDSDDTHSFEIPETTVLSAGSYLVIFSDQEKFADRFPDVNNTTGPFGFGLSGSGEVIRLYDNSGNIYLSLVYSNLSPWPQGAAGNGYTLEILDENGIFCDGDNWINGCLEGSPGVGFVPPCGNYIHENTSLNTISVSPNPTDGKFRLNTSNLQPGSYWFTCANATGKIIFSRTLIISDPAVFPEFTLEGLPEGMYYIMVISGNQKYAAKIIRQ